MTKECQAKYTPKYQVIYRSGSKVKKVTFLDFDKAVVFYKTKPMDTTMLVRKERLY